MTATLRDQLADAAHQAWMDENARNGITTRISSLTGEEQMVPFDQLSDPVKAYDYALVDTVLEALERLGYRVTKAIYLDELPRRAPRVFLSDRVCDEDEA